VTATDDTGGGGGIACGMPSGYTAGTTGGRTTLATVKTAISIDGELFEQAEQMAKATHVSRSRLYAQALRKHIALWQDRLLTEQINAAYADGPAPEDTAFLRAASAHMADLSEDDPW